MPACAAKPYTKRDASVETAEALSKSDEEGNATVNDLSRLAEAGNADAQNRLGLLYHDGQGVPVNYQRAKHWFRKAAEQGHAGAQVNLGTLYFLGDGFHQSDHAALYWFQQAAGQEDALAFAKLGRMYEKGRGVPQDFIQAHMWYNLSAAHGEIRAAEILDTLAKHMPPAQIAEAQRLARERRPKKK
jgi:TPR repeat protein